VHRLRAVALPLLVVPGVLLAAPSPVRAETISAEIMDFGFLPDDLAIAVGDEVTWVNTGATGHAITAEDTAPERFESGNLQPGTSYTRVFRGMGTFAYRCAVHPSMRATVRVAEHRTATSASGVSATPALPPSTSPAPSPGGSVSSSPRARTTTEATETTPRTQPRPMPGQPASPPSASPGIHPPPVPQITFPPPTPAPATPVAPTAAAETSRDQSRPEPEDENAAAESEPGGGNTTAALAGKILVALGALALLSGLRRRAPSYG
jgi:plastocyanin